MGKIAAGLRDPLLWTDVLQLVKTAAAAVLAWVLATQVLSLPQSFLAPWAALLVIHATVYRTLARGLQQAAAAIAGVLLLRFLGERFPLCSPAAEGPPSLPPRPWVDPAVHA